MVIGVQEVPEFIMTSAEASCRVHRAEAMAVTMNIGPLVLTNIGPPRCLTC